MKYNIDITEPAERDIQEAIRYIADELQNKTAAIRLLEDVYDAISSLDENPCRHALVNDEFLARLGIRLFPIRNYIVFYVVREKNKKVVVERFLYGKRDWIAILQG